MLLEYGTLCCKLGDELGVLPGSLPDPTMMNIYDMKGVHVTVTRFIFCSSAALHEVVRYGGVLNLQKLPV